MLRPHGPAPALLAALLETRPFRRGDVLFREGEAVPGIWVVQDGVVELAVGRNGQRLVLRLLRPGDVEGDVAVVLGRPAAYEARALSAGSCLYLDRRSFDRLLAHDPALARRWLANCMQRLEHADGRTRQLLGGSLRDRLARLVLDEAVDGAVRLPQRTLAAMLGVRRQSLNKALKDLEREGTVDVAYADVQVRDEHRLRMLSHHVPC